MYKIITFLLALFSFLNSNGQDWKWINPLPTGNALTHVEVIDSTTAFAIGKSGTILKTTNKGINWTTIESGFTDDLLYMSVIDKDTLYVCGEKLRVYKSTNGGSTWKNILNQSFNTTSFFFVNPAVGYINSHSKLYKTIDYGATWVDLNVNIEFQSVNSIFFISIDTGYAATQGGSIGKVLKTNDGGLNWSIIPLPLNTTFSTVFFKDSFNGFLIGQLGAILKTNDGGQTWEIQNEFPSSLTNSNLNNINFITNEIGFIVGGKDILKTTNGGNNWEFVNQFNNKLLSIDFTDSLNALAIEETDVTIGNSNILRTSDGGLNWDTTSYSVINSNILEVIFINSDTGYAIGGTYDTFGGFILKTTTNGDQWSIVDIGTNIYNLNDISTPDNSSIFVVGMQGQILKSNDGGETWVKQNSTTNENLYSVDFPTPQIGYCTGENGTLLKTLNGGNNWIKLEPLTDYYLSNIFFKDSITGFLPINDWEIDSTVLLTTLDGGINWERKIIGDFYYPREITFINNDTAFVIGDDGAVSRTFDSGDNWVTKYQPVRTPTNIHFINNTTGYIVGTDGEISITENCGDNWTILNTGTKQTIQSIFFTDINTGIATGSNGTIIKTTNSGISLNAFNNRNLFICYDDTIEISPNYVGGKKPHFFQWNNSESTSEITVSPKEDTTYIITITDSDNETINIEIPVSVKRLSAPIINQNGDTLVSDKISKNQWYKNDSLLLGETSQVLIVDSTGNYYSIVSDYQCSSQKSNSIYIVVNSTKSNIRKQTKIYPNPTTDKIFIGDKTAHWTIYDESGRFLHQGNTTEIDLNKYEKGVLFILIDGKSQKIIKN